MSQIDLTAEIAEGGFSKQIFEKVGGAERRGFLGHPATPAGATLASSGRAPHGRALGRQAPGQPAASIVEFLKEFREKLCTRNAAPDER